MDIFGKCKRWGSIIFPPQREAEEIRLSVMTAGFHVFLKSYIAKTLPGHDFVNQFPLFLG